MCHHLKCELECYENASNSAMIDHIYYSNVYIPLVMIMEVLKGPNLFYLPYYKGIQHIYTLGSSAPRMPVAEI